MIRNPKIKIGIVTVALLFTTAIVSAVGGGAYPSNFDLSIKNKIIDQENGQTYGGGSISVKSPVKLKDFNGYTRFITFRFKADKGSITNGGHSGVLLDSAYKNKSGVVASRGIIIGDAHLKDDGCNVPSIQFESFQIGKLHHNPEKCKQIFPDKWYYVSVHMTKDWIAYFVQEDNYKGKVVVQDAINATAEWGNSEQTANDFFDYHNRFMCKENTSCDDAIFFNIPVGEYNNDNTKIHIRNVNMGYFN